MRVPQLLSSQRGPWHRLSSVRRFHVGLTSTGSSSEARAAQSAQLRTQGVHPIALQVPTFQVFGSNTDVGKTVISAGICASAVRSGGRTVYIKPLQTGTNPAATAASSEAFQGDAAFVKQHVAQQELLECETLFSWKTPVSPHLAASLENQALTDDDLLVALSTKLKDLNGQYDADALVLVETAGGVCSPSASMRFQADVYRSLRLPVVLVGDGKLGGISATISSMESLLLRGYDIAAICLIEQDELENAEAIAPRANELGIPVFTMARLPAQPEPLTQWYEEHQDAFTSVVAKLREFHLRRRARLDQLMERAEHVLWWPFTQHKKYGGLTLIDSAHGDEFCVYRPEQSALESMFDACASWWTQGIGHGNAKMSTAMAYTASRYGHVMFPENVHEPALQLSEKLVGTVGRNWASRVFFSDDGSTAVEVALKMAFRKYAVDHKMEYGPNAPHLIALAQTNCYHGDTLGVMNIAEPSVFNEKQHPWYRPEAVFAKTPSLAYRNGVLNVEVDAAVAPSSATASAAFKSLAEACDPARDDSELAAAYRTYVNQMMDETETSSTRIGALLLEPLLIGAGGMILVDPLFQRVLVNECRARKIPVIYDEVFSGWWRLGVESARDLLGVNPDIGCYAKLLTGGVVPLAVTLATEEIFKTFYADTKGEALLHGHSFTAHPVGCAAAITAMDMYDLHHGEVDPESQVRSYWNAELVQQISSHPQVARTFELGTVVTVELKAAQAGYASSEAQQLIQVLRQNGIYARALGNVVYMMCSPLTTREECSRWLEALHSYLLELYP